MLLSTDKVDIQGTLYRIILIEGMVDSEDNEGRLDHIGKVIYVDYDISKDPQRFNEVLLHEISHAIALKLDEHETITEKDVIRLTTISHAFVSHNPDLVIDLAMMAKKAREEK